MGRPSTGVAIHVRIPADVLARLDRLAKRYGVTRAEAVRRLLDIHLPR